METVFVKPRKNLLVRSPRTRTPIPEQGCSVPWIGADGRFWRRRVRDGDVELIVGKKFNNEQVKSKTAVEKIYREVENNGN